MIEVTKQQRRNHYGTHALAAFPHTCTLCAIEAETGYEAPGPQPWWRRLLAWLERL